MQIVIDIPEEIYKKIKETNMVISGRRNGKLIGSILFNAVDDGTPLPDDAIIIDAKEQSDYVFVEKAKYNDLVEAASKALTDRIKKSLHEGVTAESDAESEDKE